MSATLPPKSRCGPSPPPRPADPLTPDAARDWLNACLEHYERVVCHGEDYTVGVAIQQAYHALRAVHRAEQPGCYGGSPNYR